MNPRSIRINELNATPHKYVRILRAAAWNVLFIISGLLLIALAGEMYLRLANPFLETSVPIIFVDGIGRIREPNAEVRYANWDDDDFVVSRTNSLGFVDREPVSAERAAAGCHIAFIGDSFVEAIQTPIADKFHVRLEDMAARELPHLDIATQAYGIGGTGQINQLPYYDEYARRLNPKLVVLVFYLNDFTNNSTPLQSLARGLDPDRMPYMSAQRDASGNMELRPPHPDYARFMLPRTPDAWHERARKRLVRVSYFAKWLDTKSIWSYSSESSQIAARANMIAERPCCASILDGWQPVSGGDLLKGGPFMEKHLPPALEEALEYTAFAVDEFKRRTDRDGARLAILAASQFMGTRGDPQFDRLSAVAEPRGVPVISNYDYIVKRGYDAEDGALRFDGHWNATGHQWVAETFLEWLKANQDVCS